MPGNPRKLITGAERRFPVRIRIAVPPEGLGRQHARMTAWLDENCGADGWAMTPSGTRGVPNDAVSIYFPDAALASAFVARWCIGTRSRRGKGRSGCATMGRRRGSRGCIGCDWHKNASSQIQGVKIVSLQVSEDRQWHVQLPLNANHPLEPGITLWKSPVPWRLSREDVSRFSYMPKI
jgi:hypothetical protein